MLPIDPIVRTVANLLRMRGGESTLVTIATGAYDPVTSSVNTTETQYTVKTIKFEYTQNMSGTSTEANTLIRSGDKQIFMLPATDVPVPDPRTAVLLFQGIKHDIITVKECNPSGVQAIYYELFIRE